MNVKSVAAHALLAIGGLTLAYLVWTDDAPSREVDEVELVDCDPDEVSEVVLRTAEKDVTLTIEREGDEVTARVEVVRHRDDQDDEADTFVASIDALDEFLELFVPLRARRSLGELDEAQLEEVGLAEDPGSLVLTCAGGSHTFRIGGRAYGSGDRYARAESGGPVQLLSNERLQALESAEFRLMERRLHTFEWTEVTGLRVDAWGQTKNLLQRNRLDENAAEWVDAQSPDRRNEAYGNWLASYPRMRVQRYLARGAEPGSDLEQSAPSERSMRLTVTGEDGELGFMEMQRVDVLPLAYYVRTETTRDWVRVPVSVAQAFEDDLRSVLGLDPLDRPEPEPVQTPAVEPGGESASETGAETEAEGASEPGAESETEGATETETESEGATETESETE